MREKEAALSYLDAKDVRLFPLPFPHCSPKPATSRAIEVIYNYIVNYRNYNSDLQASYSNVVMETSNQYIHNLYSCIVIFWGVAVQPMNGGHYLDCSHLLVAFFSRTFLPGVVVLVNFLILGLLVRWRTAVRHSRERRVNRIQSSQRRTSSTVNTKH